MNEKTNPDLLPALADKNIVSNIKITNLNLLLLYKLYINNRPMKGLINKEIILITEYHLSV
jgi:hypothetical protein